MDVDAPAKYTKKLVFCLGCAPDPAVGAYNAPQTSIVGWEGEHSLSISFPPRRIRRLDLGASVVRPPTQIPGYAYGLPNFFWPTAGLPSQKNLARWRRP